MSKELPLFASLLCALLLSGCSMMPQASAPGIQPVEYTLRVGPCDPDLRGYEPSPYHRGKDALAGSPQALKDFFGRSLINHSKEHQDAYASDLELLLFELGDTKFSEAISVQPEPVKRKVALLLSWIFSRREVRTSYYKTRTTLALKALSTPGPTR